METAETKIVDFAKYCPQCKYWQNGKDDEVCNECLTYGGSEDRRPILFKNANETEEENPYYETDANGKVKTIKKYVRKATKNGTKTTVSVSVQQKA